MRSPESWFEQRRQSFPTKEYQILEAISELQFSSKAAKPRMIAEHCKQPLERVTAWLSILRRRDLVDRDRQLYGFWSLETNRYEHGTREVASYLLTNLGEQRLAWLRDQVPKQTSAASVRSGRRRGIDVEANNEVAGAAAAPASNDVSSTRRSAPNAGGKANAEKPARRRPSQLALERKSK
jgi:hypothetical protein